MKVLIGSMAMKSYADLKNPPKDADYFSDHDKKDLDDHGTGRVEVFYDERLAQYAWAQDADTGGTGVATLDELYTIKVSHAFWDLRNKSWSKHMSHMMDLKKAGATFIPELYEILYAVWKDLHGAKRANLEVENPEDFFTSTVVRKYDHDSLHASVAYYDRPLFESILRDGHAIAVSKKKFDDLPHDDKVKLVKEEIFATALERDLIPDDSGRNWRVAYQKHLKKLITSYSKGWFPLWVVLHFDEVCTNRVNYWDRMQDQSDRLILLDA